MLALENLRGNTINLNTFMMYLTTTKEVNVVLHAMDRCDHFFILEYRDAEDQFPAFRFVFVTGDGYVADDQVFKTQVDALKAFNVRFMIDNCDEDDTADLMRLSMAAVEIPHSRLKLYTV